MNLPQIIEKARASVVAAGSGPIEIGLVLGSGLGGLADDFEDKLSIPYSSIPGFVQSTVEGHAGRLVIGNYQGRRVAAMQGRIHYYEGYSMQQVTFPVRLMRALGASDLIVTNACGGLNPDFHPGTLMVIRDHINFMGDNPLIGPNHEELGPRFPDMSRAYDPDLVELALSKGREFGLPVQSGVYCAVTGPNYNTRAELAMVRAFGADAIGMSTVPEVIAGVHAGFRILGISCVTDMAIPSELEPLTHDRVVEVANATRPRFVQLLGSVIKEM